MLMSPLAVPGQRPRYLPLNTLPCLPPLPWLLRETAWPAFPHPVLLGPPVFLSRDWGLRISLALALGRMTDHFICQEMSLQLQLQAFSLQPSAGMGIIQCQEGSGMYCLR